MKTIAQQLNVKEFPFEIKDSNGNEIYYEASCGYWSKSEYDSKGNRIYYENSFEFSWKREYDSKRKEIYYEDSNGYIRDNRPKTLELTLDEIAEKFNVPVSSLKLSKGWILEF